MTHLWQVKGGPWVDWTDLTGENGETYNPPMLYKFFAADTELSVRRMAAETYNPTNYSNEATLLIKKLVFSNWAEQNGLSGDDAAFDADPDGDGLNNLGEYALGGNPNTDDAASFLPVNEVNASGVVEYVYRRRLDRVNLGLTYGLNTSTNLPGGWTDAGTSHETAVGAIDDTFESVTNAVPFAGEAGFIQLKVTDD